MEMPDRVEEYVRRVRRALRWDPVLARRVEAEVRDHLAEAMAEEELAGVAVPGLMSSSIVRGADPSWLRESSVHDEIVRHPSEDLFR